MSFSSSLPSEVIMSTFVTTSNCPGSKSFHVRVIERAVPSKLEPKTKTDIEVQHSVVWTGGWHALKSIIIKDSKDETEVWLKRFYESLKGFVVGKRHIYIDDEKEL